MLDYARAMVLLDTYAWLPTYRAHPTDGASPWIAPNLDVYFRFHRSINDAPWLYMSNRTDVAHDSLIASDGEIRDELGRLCVSATAQHLCSRRPQQFK